MAQLCSVVGCANVGWAWSHDAAIKRAQRENRRMLVVFHKPLNGDCMAMDRDAFNDPDVAQVMRHYVPVRLDFNLNASLARAYGISRVPGFVVVRPDGETVNTHEGRLDAEPFRVWLISHIYK